MRRNGLVGIRRFYSSSHLGGFGKRFHSVHELHDREHGGHAKRLEHQPWAFAREGLHRAEREQQRYNDDTQRDDPADERAVESAPVVLMGGVCTSTGPGSMMGTMVEHLPRHDRISGSGEDRGRSPQSGERADLVLVPLGRALQ